MLIVKSSHAPLQLNSDTATKINELDLKYEREREGQDDGWGGWVGPKVFRRIWIWEEAHGYRKNWFLF